MSQDLRDGDLVEVIIPGIAPLEATYVVLHSSPEPGVVRVRHVPPGVQGGKLIVIRAAWMGLGPTTVPIFLENSDAMLGAAKQWLEGHPDWIQRPQEGGSQIAKYCSNCGRGVRDTAKFCSECGAALVGTPTAQQSRSPVMETCQIIVNEKDTFGGIGAHCILEAVALGPYGRRVLKRVEFGASRYPGEWPRDRRVTSQLNAMVAELARDGWEPSGSAIHPYFGVSCPTFRRQYGQV